MKQNDITKLYQKLSSTQKASMVINAQITGDQETSDKIVETVERFTYSQIDNSFLQRTENIWDVLSLLTGEFWQTSYFQLLSTTKSILSRKNSDVIFCENLHEQREYYSEKLIALNLVIEQIASRFDLDADAVRKFLGFSTEAPLPPVDHLSEVVKEYYDAMLEVIVSRIENRDANQESVDYFKFH